eukprot:244622-Rhodomonas_salina.1
MKVYQGMDTPESSNKPEDSLAESATMICFLTEGYFRSRDCRHEVYAAIALNKPVIVVYEAEERTRGPLLDELKAECREACQDRAEYHEAVQAVASRLTASETHALSGPDQVIDALFAEEPFWWISHSLHHFEVACLKQVVARILEHLP